MVGVAVLVELHQAIGEAGVNLHVDLGDGLAAGRAGHADLAVVLHQAHLHRVGVVRQRLGLAGGRHFHEYVPTHEILG